MGLAGGLLALLASIAARNCSASEQKMAAAAPLAPRVVTFKADKATIKTVVGEVAKQTGQEVDTSEIDVNKTIKADFDKTEFWKAVDSIAAQSGSRVAAGQIDKPVRLVPAVANVKPIVAVDGPFHFSAQKIEVQSDLIGGSAHYELTLEIAWESRLPVFRMDAAPTIDKGEDDAGRPIRVKPIASRVGVDGVAALVKVRMDGITRQSKQIAVLKGSYLVTLAEEMVRCRFDDLGKLPAVKKQNGVDIQLKRFAKEGSFWIADIDLGYPPGGPVFESFEIYWLSRNRITVISPDGKKITTDDEQINGSSIRYRFKETKDFKPANLNGWKLEYETPGVMREVPVKFELKGIPLP